MGIRGELYSTKVQLQNRTYFFNVKENRMGDLYLNIVESKNRGEGSNGFERQSVILFAEDLSEFLAGFDESLKVLERQVKERKRNRSALFRVDRDYEPEPSDSPKKTGTGSKKSYRRHDSGGDSGGDRPRKPYGDSGGEYRNQRPPRVLRPKESWEDDR